MRRVVITGMGIISPLGNDIDTYWKNLTAGVCGIGPITRFDTAGFKAKLAAEVKDFRPSEFSMDVPAARRLDLYTQYAMAAASQAARESGIVGSLPPERLGVYVGSGIGGMHTLTSEANKLTTRGPERVSPFFIPMMIGNIASGNIAMRYDAQGPTLPIVTACATSANAIGEAYRAIGHGYADAIFAGGAEATVEPLAIAGFINCQALSLSVNARAASIPFDKRRAGFVMGEGAGILLLEEYERANKRGAPIYAELCGYGNTSDAYHVTAPREDGRCAARAIRLAAEEAGITDSDSVYINTHGTGTPLNDKSETLAIKLALGEECAYRRTLISSSKSMMGHLLGAAGGAEAIVAALTLKHGIVTPTIGYEEPDPDCDLDCVPNAARERRVTLALSTSLGFGGHNACIALRQANE